MEDNYLAKWIDGESKEDVNDPVLQQIKEVSGQLTTPDFDKEKVFENIQQNKAKSKTSYFKWSIAASLLVIIGLGSLYLLSSKSFNTKAMASENIQLPDKSQVMLQSGSQLNFNTFTWSLDRKVNLEGAAFFDVEKGAVFTVSTQNGDIKVLGTEFKVSSFQNQLLVRCYEGSVSIEKNGKQSIIKPGDRIVVDQNNKRHITKDLDLSFEQSGKEEFYNYRKTFLELTELLEKLYDIKISSEVKRDKHFTGAIPLYDLKKALNIITNTYQVNYQQEVENSYIFVDNESTKE